jgi:hypothetical protein
MLCGSRLFLLVTVLAVLVVPGVAQAAGGSYLFDGGTPAEQETVHSALEVSAFDWSLVPATVTIHIARGHASQATPGQIWLDADLLDAGRFSWGIIQHEYAHQVDFFLLHDADRASLAPVIGGSMWWSPARTALAPNGRTAHSQLSSERFASTLAWAYWQSPANSMRPQSRTDESAAVAPRRFRALLEQVLGGITR